MFSKYFNFCFAKKEPHLATVMTNWVSLSEQISTHLHGKICFLKHSNELGNLVRPFSVGLCPTVIFLRYLKDIQIFEPSGSNFTPGIINLPSHKRYQSDLSLVSKTLCHVIVLGSMSKNANFLEKLTIMIRGNNSTLQD